VVDPANRFIAETRAGRDRLMPDFDGRKVFTRISRMKRSITAFPARFSKDYQHLILFYPERAA